MVTPEASNLYGTSTLFWLIITPNILACRIPQIQGKQNIHFKRALATTSHAYEVW